MNLYETQPVIYVAVLEAFSLCHNWLQKELARRATLTSFDESSMILSTANDLQERTPLTLIIVSRILGQRWRDLHPHQKSKYRAMAADIKANYEASNVIVSSPSTSPESSPVLEGCPVNEELPVLTELPTQIPEQSTDTSDILSLNQIKQIQIHQ